MNNLNKKTIEDIKIKKGVTDVRPAPSTTFSSKRLSNGPSLPKEKRKLRKLFLSLFLISFFSGIIFWGSLLFEKVNITITKKHQIFKLEEKDVFTASKNSDSPIPFEIMIFSDKNFENINLTKKEEVSRKSKGEITLYNEYSSKTPEKLSANTYLSDENGKVYLLDKNISIPPYTLKDNKVIPGEVSVSLTSFLPGESYNGNPTSFTINSYKNTSKWNKVYGKALTSFSGGATGFYYSLEEKDIEQLKNIANTSFKDNLIEKVDSLIPEEFIYYKDGYNFSYKIKEDTLSSTMNTKINISGTLSVVLFKKDELRKAIIKNKIPKISDKEMQIIEIDGMDKLILKFTNKDQLIEKGMDSVSFSLIGQLDFIWNPDIPSLKNDLKGIPKDDILEIFRKDVSVGNANIKIFPPWQKNIPLNEEKIKIKVL